MGGGRRGTCQEEEEQSSDPHVSKVQQPGDKFRDLKLRVEVEDRVREHVARRGARGEEGTPPPVIILCTELEVAHDDSDFCACDE